MDIRRLQGRKVSAAILKKGRVWKGQAMVIRWLPGTPPTGGRSAALPSGVYLGTFASTSLSASAVKRNRMRRRCREALRLELALRPTLPSVQLLLAPRSASLDAPFAVLQKDAATFLALLRP